MSESEISFARSESNAPAPAVASVVTDRPSGRRRTDRIVGASQNTQTAIEQISATARSEANVLIVGPSGCGKRHLARAVHSWSGRSSGPLITLPIPALPESVCAEEIFGAVNPSNPLPSGSIGGAIESAAGGTLILHRIDKLPQQTRSSLLGALRTGSFRRVGQLDGEAVSVRARIVATAGENAADALGDLRAQVIEVSGLAERKEDVLPLAAHFLAEVSREGGVSPVGFTADARRLLVEEAWSANVRELRERVRMAFDLSGQGAISAESLMLSPEGENVPSFKEAKRAFETRYVEGLLRRCSGNISRAARLAKKDRKDFYDVIRRTGIDPQEFRP